MPIYIYETIPGVPGESLEVFEIQQSMRDAALTRHPETGKPIRRVITGGFGYIGGSSRNQSPAPSAGCGHGSCGCHPG